MLYTDFIFILEEEYSQTSSNGHLSTMATSLQWPFFFADSPYIDSCHGHFLLSPMWPLKRGSTLEKYYLISSCPEFFFRMVSSHPTSRVFLLLALF